MKHGTVVNAAPELIGKTALMRDHESNCDLIMLQFDDMTLEYEGKFLASGWHAFHRDSFETDDERAERGVRELVKMLADEMTPAIVGVDFSRSAPLYHTGSVTSFPQQPLLGEGRTRSCLPKVVK